MLAASTVAMASAAAALALAAQHPLSPTLALAGVLAMAWLTLLRPGAWLFWLPALLPVLNAAPWTGWWLLDESDLLVLAVLAGGYARWAFAMRRRWTPPDEAICPVRAEPVEALRADHPELVEGLAQCERLNPHGACTKAGALRPCGQGTAAAWPGWRGGQGLGWLCLALATTLLLGMLRGWLDAGDPGPWNAWAGALTASHNSGWNTPRVAKSLLWALLLLPLLRHAVAVGLARHFAAGMLAGLLLVGVLVLWERHQFAGVLDFTLPYRTSAGFWEMHVGGGAIDAYLALALPFACWALWTARTRLRWGAALFLLALGLYAVLTTYSRGVALAVLLSLGAMLLLARRLRLLPAAGVGARVAVLAVGLLLLGEVALVLGGGAVLSSRLARSNADLMGRVAHWQAGLGLLQSPADWLLGLGLGRLPAHYSDRVPGGEFPGQATWTTDAQGHGALLLSGPPTQAALAREFGLTQRVRLDPGGGYLVRWEVAPLEANEAKAGGLVGGAAAQAPQTRAQPGPNKPHSRPSSTTPPGAPHPGASVRLFFSLCERHLLYSGRCQERVVIARSGPQTRPLRGPAFERAGGVFSVAVLGAGQSVRLKTVQLLDSQGRPLLRNAAFTHQLLHWWPSAQGQFQPWHIDNLYLELLVERGWLGLGVMLAWLAWAVAHLRRRLHQRDDLAWVLSGALLGLLALGAVVSVMENPRLALLAMLCMWLAEPRFQAKPHTPEGAET